MARGQRDLVSSVDTEALHADVGREHGQVRQRDLPSPSDRFADRGSHVQGGVEEDRLGQQGGELEGLLLLGIVVCDHPALPNRQQKETSPVVLSE